MNTPPNTPIDASTTHSELFDTIASVEAAALVMETENQLRPDPARMAAEIAELKRRVACLERWAYERSVTSGTCGG